MPISRTPRVFVSAASSDLRTARTVVNAALTRIECLPIEESVFGTEYGAIRDLLARQIASCQAVIHCVGRDYGGEPDPQSLPAGQPRRSWTQIEYDLARQQNKKLYLLVCDETFPFDQPAPPEADDQRALQQAHRVAVLADTRLSHRVQDTADLRQQVENLKVPLDEVRAELRRQQRRQRWLSGLAVAALVLVLAAVFWRVRRVGEEVGKLPGQIEQAQRDTLQQLTDPAVLAETIRKQIRATAENKITALPDQPGRWRLVAEIEQGRDLALGRVEELIKLLQEGLQEGASPVFQRATEIVQKEGINAALAYLESRRPSTLETARRHADQAKAAQARADAEKEQRNRTLQALTLEAELLETQLQWPAALALRAQVAALAPDWFEARNALGYLLRQLARNPEAEPHYRAALALAANPAEEAIALNNLAQLLQATNRLAQAEPLMRRALALGEQAYGPAHPKVALRLNNLAQLLQATNRLAQAEPLMRRALALNEQAYGPAHPTVAIALNNLAQLLQDTNRLAQAEPLMRRALALDEQAYGPAHPTVAIALNNLARLLQATNRLAQAEPLVRRALALDEQAYGPAHPTVARDLNNLAQLLQATNRLAQAEPLMRRALAFDEQAYGPAHPTVAIDLNNLARLLQATNRLTPAESLMRRAVMIVVDFTRRTGHEHPHQRAALANYAGLLKAMSLPDATMQERLQEIQAAPRPLQPILPEVEQVLGPAPPVAEVLAALDRQYKEEGRPAVYFLASEQALTPQLDALLRPHAEALNAAGVGAYRQGEHASAIVHYDEALTLLAGQRDAAALTFTVRMNRAAALRELGEAAQARMALRTLLAEPDTEPAITARSKGRAHYHLALCAWRLNDREAAQHAAAASLQAYGDDADAAALKKQTVQLLADLQTHTPPPALAQGNADLALQQARTRFRARLELATLPAEQSALPLLDQMLDPAQPTAEVFETLDRQYRADHKPALWFLPLDQPITPHLDELLGPMPVEAKPE